VAGITATGCIITEGDGDDIDDVGGFAGDDGSGGTSTGGTSSGGTGGTSTGGTGGTSTGGTGPVDVCQDPDSDEFDDPTKCCVPCALKLCKAEYDMCEADENRGPGQSSCWDEMIALQACLAKAKAEATAEEPYDYADALEACAPEASQSGLLRGTTNKLVACLRGAPANSTGDCVPACFYGE
jgi:hypothetical protein